MNPEPSSTKRLESAYGAVPCAFRVLSVTYFNDAVISGSEKTLADVSGPFHSALSSTPDLRAEHPKLEALKTPKKQFLETLGPTTLNAKPCNPKLRLKP